jgi:hypothetical protein
VIDARRKDRRYIVESDEVLTAFLELEGTLRQFGSTNSRRFIEI